MQLHAWNPPVGKELGADGLIEKAADPTKNGQQLARWEKGAGEFTAGVLGTVAQNCPSAPVKTEPWQDLWRTRDEAEPPVLRINEYA